MKLKKSEIVLYGTMAMYIGSLLLPGLTIGTAETSMYYGYQILPLGLVGIAVGLVPCYGYLLGGVSFIALQKGKIKEAFICSTIGFLFSLQALYLQKTNAEINFGGSFNSWEKGMGELSVGYYLWLFALSLLVIQCGIRYFTK